MWVNYPACNFVKKTTPQSFCNITSPNIDRFSMAHPRSSVDRVRLGARPWRALGDRTATTVRAVRAQTDNRPNALRSKSRSAEFWTFQNSALRLKWLQRLVRPTTTTLRPYWDRSETLLRSHSIWSGCSIYGRSLGVTGVLGKWSFKIPPHLKCVATLPCEIYIFKICTGCSHAAAHLSRTHWRECG